MRIIYAFLFLIISTNSLLGQQILIDFGSSTGGQYWSVTNDGVMGGLSKGRAYLTDSSVVFQGEVSLENNGGFSSLRSPYERFQLSNFKEVELKFRSSGLPFSITFSKSRRFWIPNYKHFLITEDEEWSILKFSLSDLKEYRLGDPTYDRISRSDIENIIGISFFNEGKKEGKFSLEVDYILFQ